MSAEIVNLRLARKRARRGKSEADAAAQRVAHGTPKALRDEIEARRDKAARDLDAHRRDTERE
jgi:F0F1-type ATP synthase membrane subunit b/b'